MKPTACYYEAADEMVSIFRRFISLFLSFYLSIFLSFILHAIHAELAQAGLLFLFIILIVLSMNDVTVHLCAFNVSPLFYPFVIFFFFFFYEMVMYTLCMNCEKKRLFRALPMMRVIPFTDVLWMYHITWLEEGRKNNSKFNGQLKLTRSFNLFRIRYERDLLLVWLLSEISPLEIQISINCQFSRSKVIWSTQQNTVL